jgi:hypothetical protein
MIGETSRRQLAMRKRTRKQKWHEPHTFDSSSFPFDDTKTKNEPNEPMEKEEEEEEECGHVGSHCGVFGRQQTPAPYAKEDSMACPLYFDLSTFDMLNNVVNGLEEDRLNGPVELSQPFREDSALEWLIPEDACMWGQESGAWEQPMAPYFLTDYQNCEALFPLSGF